MKNFNSIKAIIAVFALLVFGCSSSSDDSNGGDDNQVTSINLTIDDTGLLVGEIGTFAVKTNANQDVTSNAEIKLSGNPISGNSYYFENAGSYQFVATYNGLTSNTLAVTCSELQIILSANSTSVNLGDTVTFTVNTNGGDNVTAMSSIQLDGSPISGNTFTPNMVGTYQFSASYGSLVSNSVTVTATQQAVKFKKNVLIEDYTGTWCGYCPRVAYGIELVEGQTNQVVVVASHLSSTTPDPYQNSLSLSLANSFGVSGLPTAKLDRTMDWDYPEPNNVNQVISYTATDADAGIALNPVMNGNNLDVNVQVNFGGDFSSANTKLVVYLLEDGLVYNQTNYTSYYGGASTIVGFIHDNVLRAGFTAALGNNIPANESVAGNIYSTSVSMSLPSSISNTNNLKVVAMVVTDGNQAINSRVADFGEDQSFEVAE